jgi:hypothetical protein
MARMLGRWHASGCRCQARYGSTGPDCAGGGRDTRWRKRVERREVERELAEYPSGYSPVTLISTQPDGPDLTGALIGWEG